MAADKPKGANIEELTGNAEQFIEKNSRTLTFGIAAVAVIILSLVGYSKFWAEPRETAANEDSWRAEEYYMMGRDSLALIGDGLYPGLYDIAEDHDGTKAAARAEYEIGLILRSNGDYEGAIEAFQNAGLEDDVLATIAIINVGDCEVELGNYDAAQSAFEDAIDQATSSIGENYLAPIALYKGALVDLELDNADAARSKLGRIVEDYPTSDLQATAKGLAAAI